MLQLQVIITPIEMVMEMVPAMRNCYILIKIMRIMWSGPARYIKQSAVAPLKLFKEQVENYLMTRMCNRYEGILRRIQSREQLDPSH